MSSHGDFYSIAARKYVIEGREFKSIDKASTYLQSVCCLSASEAYAYVRHLETAACTASHNAKR